MLMFRAIGWHPAVGCLCVGVAGRSSGISGTVDFWEVVRTTVQQCRVRAPRSPALQFPSFRHVLSRLLTPGWFVSFFLHCFLRWCFRDSAAGRVWLDCQGGERPEELLTSEQGQALALSFSMDDVEGDGNPESEAAADESVSLPSMWAKRSDRSQRRTFSGCLGNGDEARADGKANARGWRSSTAARCLRVQVLPDSVSVQKHPSLHCRLHGSLSPS